MEQRIQLSDHFGFGRLIRFTIPSILMMIFTSIYGVVDGYFVSNFVGKTPFAAVNFIMPFLMVVGAMGFMFGTGGSALIARIMGEGRREKAQEIFSLLIAATVVSGLVIAVISILFLPQIAAFLGAKGGMLADCIRYGRIILVALPFLMLQYAFGSLSVTAEKPKLGLIVTIISGVLNMTGDVLFMGVFHWGIAGAAIASSISEAVSVLFFILYTWKKVDYGKYGLFEYSGIDFRMLKQILSVSIWIMIQHGIAFLGWFVFFVVMEHQGERPLAITNVVRSISSFLFMFVNAFASTSSSLVSNLIGAGKPEQVMGLCGRMIRICYYFVLPLGILIALFPELVLRIYTDNPDLIASSVSSLWVMLSSYLIAVPAFIFFFSVSGTGNTQTALLIDMVSIFVYVFYALWVGIRIHADVAVCWTTEHVYDLMILSAFFYLWKGNWRNKKL